MLALQGLTPSELSSLAGIDLVDARRLVSLVHRAGALPATCPPTVRRAALDKARALGGHVPTLGLRARTASELDPFVKYAFELEGGAVIETVRIPLERAGRFSVCVSSQVGCALGCSYCATGRMGLVRNLEAWEIVEQVRAVRVDSGAPIAAPDGAPKIHGVLFQGMGEPMANLDRVLAAIRVLGEPAAQAIDLRNITVSTVGIPAGIRRLAREVPQARLAVSLGSAYLGVARARGTPRRALLPIDEQHPLEEVLEAAGEHTTQTGYAPLFALTLLAGLNDSDADAHALADLALDFAKRFGKRPRLSLIPWNPIEPEAPAPDAPRARATEPLALARSPRLDAVRDVLFGRGVGAIVRYSGGADVGAACGQLASATRRAPKPRDDRGRRGGSAPPAGVT